VYAATLLLDRSGEGESGQHDGRGSTCVDDADTRRTDRVNKTGKRGMQIDVVASKTVQVKRCWSTVSEAAGHRLHRRASLRGYKRRGEERCVWDGEERIATPSTRMHQPVSKHKNAGEKQKRLTEAVSSVRFECTKHCHDVKPTSLDSTCQVQKVCKKR
jgi:hypothetical protein